MKNFIIAFLFITINSFGQRFSIIEGDLNNLKNISIYNIEFDYSNLAVHGFDSEEDFLNDKLGKRKNNEEKANKFKEHWFEDRAKVYEPAFINYFNTRYPKKEIQITNETESKHLLKIKAKWIYPGYSNEPAKMSYRLSFINKEQMNKALLIIDLDKLVGIEKNQFVNDEAERIKAVYEKLAKNLSIQLKRIL